MTKGYATFVRLLTYLAGALIVVKIIATQAARSGGNTGVYHALHIAVPGGAIIGLVWIALCVIAGQRLAAAGRIRKVGSGFFGQQYASVDTIESSPFILEVFRLCFVLAFLFLVLLA
jgi:hypothetical protein